MSKTEKAENENMFSLTLASTQNFQREIKQRSIILNRLWYVPTENKHHF